MSIWKKFFGDGSKAAATPSIEQLAVTTLPPITQEHLHRGFDIPPRQPTGPGSRHLLAAREPWNSGDYATAFELFQAAIRDGVVEGTWLSTAHCCVGQIYIRHGDLRSAVEQFLKCLALPVRDTPNAWQSAQRLYYIYSEAGRSDEATALRDLSNFANARHTWAHTPNVETERRRLTRAVLHLEPNSTDSAVETHGALTPRITTPYRTRLDYETPRGIELSMALMDHHIEGLQQVIPICMRDITAKVSPQICDQLVVQLSQPLRGYINVSRSEATEKFLALFSLDLRPEVALAIVQSVDCLAGDNAKWKFLTRKFFRYTFDIHTGLVPFTEQELQ